ncbi:MAG: YihY/virulence factor BrkB family protein [Pyrinomonadaceae bacterium]|nr:YihY/virulence factor BrkB family protein [Pyrinomonadaceae bacterium]
MLEMFDELLQFRPIKFSVRLYQKAFHDDIFSRAAQVGFYFSFAIFPLLFFLVSLFGLILGATDDLRRELFDYLRQIMPLTASKLVETTLTEVAVNSSGGKLTIGFLIAIWSASQGFDSLRIALNHVYSYKENRWWWTTKGLSLLLTVVIGILFAIALTLVLYGTHTLEYLMQSQGLADTSPIFFNILKLAIIFLVLLLTFAIIYNLCPNHPKFRWHWWTWGTFVAIILWLILSGIFRLYLSFFNNYDKTYGSLGAVIILMFWLYLTALVILIGGAINGILDEFNNESEKELEDTINPS